MRTVWREFVQGIANTPVEGIWPQSTAKAEKQPICQVCDQLYQMILDG